MPHLFHLMDDWINGLQRKHRSPTTIRAHNHAIHAFRAWWETQGVPADCDALDLGFLERYVLFLRDARRDPPLDHRTIHAYIGVIVRWLDWMESRGKFAGVVDTQRRCCPRDAPELIAQAEVDGRAAYPRSPSPPSLL